MATIVTRAGKGSALTHNELDANFSNLNSTKLEAADIAGKADVGHTHTLANVSDVTVTVANLNTLDDGVNTALHFHDADRARANHTGTQTASTISDFNSAARAQVEAELIAGTNVTITPGSSGATRTLTIAASGGGGSAITVKDEGTDLTTALTSLDFVGGGVAATNTGGAVTVTIAGGGGGDASTNTATSVDSEVAVFSGTGGKTIKRATGTGPAKLTSGVLSASAINLTSEVTGTLPVANGGTGITSLGTGVATFLGTPSSANLAAAVTGETGSGALVFGTSPTIDAPSITGVYTTSGAQITTANAMGALAIDVTKGLNTKSVSVDSTFTFSATPTTDTWFSMWLVNSDTNPHTMTIPSSYSMARAATVTTFVIPASGQMLLTWRYDGSVYRLFANDGYLNKFDATTAPTTSDDLDLGYGPGSLWIDATNNEVYICESNANGAAVWHTLTDGGAGGGNVSNSGTPTSGQAAEWTSATVVQGVAVTGTGNYVKATSPTLTTPNIGTPSAGTLTSCTGLPISTGVSGLGTGVATFLGTPSSANLIAAVTDETGTGALVFANTPTLVAPVLGTPTSGNLSNCTADGTDAVGFRNVPANSQSAAYTCVASDAGKSIDHPSTDANARTYTIPANASVAYPIGTCISFSNMTSQAVTIAINTDTMYLAGTGTTGSRTLAQYGVATARKLTSTTWIINGTGLT